MLATASALHTRFEYRPGKRNSDHGNHQLHRRWILTIHVYSQFFCVKWLGLHRPRPPSSVLAWPVPSGASRHQVSKPPPPKTVIVPPPGGLYVPIELPYGVGILLLFRWDSPKLKPRFPLCGAFPLVTTTEPCARAAARAWSSHRQSPPSLMQRNDLAPCSEHAATFPGAKLSCSNFRRARHEPREEIPARRRLHHRRRRPEAQYGSARSPTQPLYSSGP
jgi:hypothetical protein